MEYVEILRARRILLWYGIVLLAIVGLAILAVYSGNGKVHTENGTVNFSSFVKAGTFGALVVATFIAPGLSAESATTPIIWTRPVTRESIAWRYIGIDVATIVIGYALLVASSLIVAAAADLLRLVTFTATASLTAFALGMGAAVMWYAMISVVAARLPGRGGMIAGLSWAVFLVTVALTAAPFPPLIHAVFTLLDYLNPMAWLGNMGSSERHEIIALSAPLRAAGTWGIAAIAIVASVRLWSTREA